MRVAALDMVYELARQDERVVFIGSDLGAGVLDKFKREMPERFFMEGISEAFVIGMAAGMAMEGKVPFINTIATFLTRRCYEQIVLDLCLHNLPVRLIGSGGGVVYAPLGPTHLAIEDISLLSALPNMAIIAPSDAQEMRAMVPLTMDYPGPVYIRLGKGGDPVVSTPGYKYQLGAAVPMREGKEVLLITTGITLSFALQAAELLAAEHGIQAGVLHLPTIKPLDSKAIVAASRRVSAIITVEEGVLSGGLGSTIATLLMEQGGFGSTRFKRLGIADEFPHKYGSQASMMAGYGISTEGILDAVKQLIQ